MRVVTAFRSGGLYTEEHINRLRDQVKIASGLDLEPIFGEYPHWWCKMTVFKEKGPLLYLDLDTTIVDDLTPLLEVAEKERFVIGRNWNYPEKLASGMMAWRGDMSHVHDDFAQNANLNMNTFPGGDQDFINEGNYHPTFWQDLLPNHIQSYKIHVKRNGIHPDCCVVAYHGRPKPWDIPEIVKE